MKISIDDAINLLEKIKAISEGNIIQNIEDLYKSNSASSSISLFINRVNIDIGEIIKKELEKIEEFSTFVINYRNGIIRLEHKLAAEHDCIYIKNREIHVINVINKSYSFKEVIVSIEKPAYIDSFSDNPTLKLAYNELLKIKDIKNATALERYQLYKSTNNRNLLLNKKDIYKTFQDLDNVVQADNKVFERKLMLYEIMLEWQETNKKVKADLSELEKYLKNIGFINEVV